MGQFFLDYGMIISVSFVAVGGISYIIMLMWAFDLMNRKEDRHKNRRI